MRDSRSNRSAITSSISGAARFRRGERLCARCGCCFRRRRLPSSRQFCSRCTPATPKPSPVSSAAPKSSAALFVLMSFLALGRQLRTSGVRGRSGGPGLAQISLAAALLSKESAFTAIALGTPAARLAGSSRRRYVSGYVSWHTYAVIGCAYLALRVLVVGSLTLPAPPDTLDNPLAHVAPSVRIATALVVLCDYLLLFIMPIQLTRADYSFNAIPARIVANRSSAAGRGVSVAVGRWVAGVQRAAHQRRRGGAYGLRSSHSRSPPTFCSRSARSRRSGCFTCRRWVHALVTGRARLGGCRASRGCGSRCWLVVVGRRFSAAPHMECAITTGRTSVASVPSHGVLLSARQRQGALQRSVSSCSTSICFEEGAGGITIERSKSTHRMPMRHLASHACRTSCAATSLRRCTGTTPPYSATGRLAKAHLNIGVIYLPVRCVHFRGGGFATGLQDDPLNPACYSWGSVRQSYHKATVGAPGSDRSAERSRARSDRS